MKLLSYRQVRHEAKGDKDIYVESTKKIQKTPCVRRVDRVRRDNEGKISCKSYNVLDIHSIIEDIVQVTT